MVNVTVTHLITKRNYIAVFISESTSHEIIIKITQNRLDMLILSCLLILFPEFIYPIPVWNRNMLQAYRISHGHRHHENRRKHQLTVSVRIKYTYVLSDKCIGHIGVYRIERKFRIINMAVASPVVLSVLVNPGTAHICIVKYMEYCNAFA